MVYTVNCECDEMVGSEINSINLFNKLKAFFEDQVKRGIYKDNPVEAPFYVGKGASTKIEWFASKWYKCNVRGCLWEFEYPDFPAKGFVRKFADGIYHPKEYYTGNR